MRLADYPKKIEVGGGDYFAVDSLSDGTKAVNFNDIKKSAISLTTKEEYYAFLDNIGISHTTRRQTFRGNNLGSVLTDDQKEEIGLNRFHNLFLGDYWEIGGNKWRIYDFNYWNSVGTINAYVPHLIIVPDYTIGSAVPMMQNTDSTDGGYKNSYVKTDVLPSILDDINALFGESNILNRSVAMSTSASDGIVNSSAIFESKIDIMNELMVYGSRIHSPSCTFDYTMDKTQLSLFQLYPPMIVARVPGERRGYWLRDISSSSRFCAVSLVGMSYTIPSSNAETGYIRPAFGLSAA